MSGTFPFADPARGTLTKVLSRGAGTALAEAGIPRNAGNTLSRLQPARWLLQTKARGARQRAKNEKQTGVVSLAELQSSHPPQTLTNGKVNTVIFQEITWETPSPGDRRCTRPTSEDALESRVLLCVLMMPR